MTITAQYVAEHFEELAAQVEAGEPLEITGPGDAVLHLVVRSKSSAPPQGSGVDRVLGSGAGLLRHLSDEEWAGMDREFETIWNEDASGRSPE